MKEIDELEKNQKKTDELTEATKKVSDALFDAASEQKKQEDMLSNAKKLGGKLELTPAQFAKAAIADFTKGWTPEQLKSLEGSLNDLGKAYEAAEVSKKKFADAKEIIDFAEKVRESLLTPIEQFKKYRDELENLGTNLTPAEMEKALTNKMGELMGKGGGRHAANDFSVIENASYRSLASITQTREDPVVAELRKLFEPTKDVAANTKTIAANTQDGGLR
jgi:hypothetical protein